MNDDNVILFPKWKTALEEESLYALKQHKYDEALEKLNKLLDYHVDNHEIITGKLICLIELGCYDEAQNLCEQLLQEKDQYYFQYLHIYLTLLFQTSQYQLLMDKIDDDLQCEHIPSPFKEQFEQLYEMSREMNGQLKQESDLEFSDEFMLAVNGQDHIRQWQLINWLRQIKVQPDLNMFIPLLKDEKIHPVIKTEIFHWLQLMNITQEIEIHKLNLRIKVKPTEVSGICVHTTIKQILFLMKDIEQDNPTLHKLLEKLLYRYAYVRYPIMPPDNDCKKIAMALMIIGEADKNLTNDVDHDDRINRYIDEIKTCEALYLSIIDD